jgi:endogenous inhibitor of DNA gyrase (YacG/DUF329 family)
MADKCPLCGKPAMERFKPFCSKRCADLDLNQWFKGSYAIPSPAVDPTPSNPSENDPEED